MPRSAPVDDFTLVYEGPGRWPPGLAETAPAPEDRIAQPTHVLWPEHDPLFPRQWSDRLDAFLADATLSPPARRGHFSPLEAPQGFAMAIRAAVATA